MIISVRTAAGFEQDLHNMTLVAVDGVPFSDFKQTKTNPAELLNRVILLEQAVIALTLRLELWDQALQDAVITGVNGVPVERNGNHDTASQQAGDNPLRNDDIVPNELPGGNP